MPSLEGLSQALLRIQESPYAESQEPSQILANLWCKASKTVDFSKSARNDPLYQQRRWQLCKCIGLVTSAGSGLTSSRGKYQKFRDQNHTSGNSLTLCPFYEEFVRVLSTESTVMHGTLLSQNGSLLASQSSMGTDGSQWQTPREDNKVTLLLKPVPEEALEEKEQQHVLGQYSEELFDCPCPMKNILLWQTGKGQKPPLIPVHF
ncbi:unnamed protein product [Caretta caretta]